MMVVTRPAAPPSPLILARYLRTAIKHFSTSHPDYSPIQVKQAIRILETQYRAATVGYGKAKAHRYQTEQYEDAPDNNEE
ncbi:MAG: hypothetical protein ACYDBB_21540 [Armatimonadota bacterium]